MSATAASTRYGLHAHDRLIGERPETYVLHVRDLPDEQKPREKLLRLGPAHLSVAELLLPY